MSFAANFAGKMAVDGSPQTKDICMLLDRADRARGPERWTNGFDDR
jgi:hypothetical protein